jgi:hypothetical protein
MASHTLKTLISGPDAQESGKTLIARRSLLPRFGTAYRK